MMIQTFDLFSWYIFLLLGCPDERVGCFLWYIQHSCKVVLVSYPWGSIQGVNRDWERKKLQARRSLPIAHESREHKKLRIHSFFSLKTVTNQSTPTPVKNNPSAPKIWEKAVIASKEFMSSSFLVFDIFCLRSTIMCNSVCSLNYNDQFSPHCLCKFRLKHISILWYFPKFTNIGFVFNLT